MATVFVPMDVRDDISAALKFGQLRYVNRYYIHGDELEPCGEYGNTIPELYRRNIELAVRNFRPDTDYLLIAGDHLQLLALAAMLAGLFGSFMVLRYDRQLRDYIPVRLYSGLAPPGAGVLRSTHIGETDHGEDRRVPKSTARALAELRAGIEAPLSDPPPGAGRQYRRIDPPQDDS